MQQAVSIKDYAVPPVVSRINAQENAVRDSVMRTMIATQRPYPLANSPHAPLLRELAARNVMALADDAVVAAYPVSGRQTNKRVI